MLLYQGAAWSEKSVIDSHSILQHLDPVFVHQISNGMQQFAQIFQRDSRSTSIPWTAMPDPKTKYYNNILY
jgi:hypothetical protein